jgi:hypothetical protein
MGKVLNRGCRNDGYPRYTSWCAIVFHGSWCYTTTVEDDLWIVH